MIELMCKIAAVGILGSVLSTVLRRHTPEIGLLLVVCAGVGIFAMAADGLMAVMGFVTELAEMARLEDELVQPVVKTVVISILTKLTVEICRGGGEPGLAVFVEMCAVVLELCVAMPLIRAVAVLMGAILE